MLDVHPPHEAAHSWKDFFIHIATIVVGLLIAVGLEQTVEAVHRHHERADLMESLHQESNQILLDTNDANRFERARLLWLQQSETQIADAIHNHHPLGPLPAPERVPGFDVPDNPVYTAAATSAKLDLLTPDEAQGFGELNAVLAELHRCYHPRQDANQQRELNRREVALEDTSTGDLATLNDPAGLRQLYAAFVQSEDASNTFLRYSLSARGAAEALAEGERHLRRIQDREKQYRTGKAG